MRFSIRQLLLLVPLFLFNTYLIAFLTFPPLRTFRYMHEVNSVMHAQDCVDMSLMVCSSKNADVSDTTINEWLAHRLPMTHSAADLLSDPPRMDSWGNPYRVQSCESVTNGVRVYSTGQDGVSHTDGNDPDDIRSWEKDRGVRYRTWQNRRESGFCMILSALVTPFVLWGLTNLTGLGRKTPPESP